jgi:transgelin
VDLFDFAGAISQQTIFRRAQRWCHSRKVYENLARLVQKIIPSLNLKPHVSTMPFKQMENINQFLAALDHIKVPKQDQFQTIDLYEEKNMTQVVHTLFAFARHAHQKDLTPILLGPKLSERHEVHFSDEQLAKGKTIIPLQAGFTGGANQSGMSFGGRRDVMPVIPKE